MLTAGACLVGLVSRSHALRRGLYRRIRHLQGRCRGWWYHLTGRHPAIEVADDVLADRIRSTLGPLEKRLDLPRVHVTVKDRVALLHGEVASDQDREAIEVAVEQIPGVAAVDCHLHVGLIGGDTRPSEGRAARPPSDAFRHLLDAARHAGAGEESARPVVRAVIATLADQLPGPARDHLFAHLPADIHPLAPPPRRLGQLPGRARHVPDLVTAVVATDALDEQHAAYVVESVLGALREIIPEEAADIAAVLPTELREFWNAAVPH